MSIELNIDNALLKKVNSVSGELNMDRDELILTAVKKFIHLQQMKKIRKSLSGLAKAKGFKSEQDIYDKL